MYSTLEYPMPLDSAFHRCRHQIQSPTHTHTHMQNIQLNFWVSQRAVGSSTSTWWCIQLPNTTQLTNRREKCLCSSEMWCDLKETTENSGGWLMFHGPSQLLCTHTHAYARSGTHIEIADEMRHKFLTMTNTSRHMFGPKICGSCHSTAPFHWILCEISRYTFRYTYGILHAPCAYTPTYVYRRDTTSHES